MIPLSLPPPTAARKLERACTATGANSINAVAAAATFQTAHFVGGRHRGKHSLPLSLRIHDDKHFVARCGDVLGGGRCDASAKSQSALVALRKAVMGTDQA